MERKRYKISYIKRPFTKNGFISFPLSVVSLILCAVSLRISVSMEGNGGLNVGALGFSSLLFAVVAMVYGFLSFLEKEKNYLLSKIGIGIGGLLLLFWICMLIVGLQT